MNWKINFILIIGVIILGGMVLMKEDNSDSSTNKNNIPFKLIEDNQATMIPTKVKRNSKQDSIGTYQNSSNVVNVENKSAFINNTLNLENDIIITEYNEIAKKNINWLLPSLKIAPIHGKVMLDLYIAVKKESDISKMDDFIEFISSRSAINIQNNLLPLLEDTVQTSRLKYNREIYSELIEKIMEKNLTEQEINQELKKLLNDHGTISE